MTEMTNCEACSHAVSYQAKVCPNCGHLLRKSPFQLTPLRLLAIAPYVAWAISWLLIYSMGRRWPRQYSGNPLIQGGWGKSPGSPRLELYIPIVIAALACLFIPLVPRPKSPALRIVIVVIGCIAGAYALWLAANLWEGFR